MLILDLINVVKSEVTGIPIYPNALPPSIDDAISLTFTGGSAPSDTLPTRRPTVQAIVRSNNPAAAESYANQIYTLLHQKGHFYVGQVRVAWSTSLNSSPIYLGQDENNRVLYSVNFSFQTIN